jgi:hypothetical protein
MRIGTSDRPTTFTLARKIMGHASGKTRINVENKNGNPENERLGGRS